MQGNLCSLREDVFENGNLIEILQASSPYNVFGDSAYDSFIGSLRETTQGFINVSIIITILYLSISVNVSSYPCSLVFIVQMFQTPAPVLKELTNCGKRYIRKPNEIKAGECLWNCKVA